MNCRYAIILKTVFTICLVALAARVADAQPLYNPANGHYYEYVPQQPIMWPEARFAAASRVFNGSPGHLATITSPQENAFVTSLIDRPGLVEAWIGAYQPTPAVPAASGWAWVTGEPFVYTNWDSDEPNDVNGTENELGIWGPAGDGILGSWNDQEFPIYGRNNIHGYVVEYGDLFGPPVELLTLITPGSIWSYLDNGSNQGTAWRTLNFDDSGWRAGPAQLGYGDGDEQTIVDCGPGPPGNCSPTNGLSNNFATTYFRITGELEGEFVAAFQGVTAGIVRDDGAAVYVNGVEVYRDASLRPGAEFNDLANYNAAGAVGGDDENAWHSFSIDPALFRAGPNVIAVEVHQQILNSSDVSFDFQMSVLVATVPEPESWVIVAMGFIPLLLAHVVAEFQKCDADLKGQPHGRQCSSGTYSMGTYSCS